MRAHHLAGGLHLGTWGGVEASQLDEREHGDLDADRIGLRLGHVELAELIAQCEPGRDPGQRHAGRLGHEREGARAPRVDLEDVQDLVADGVLDVEAALDAQFDADSPRPVLDLGEDVHGDVLRRDEAGRVPRVDARLLQMLHDGAHEHALAVAHRVDVELGGVPEVLVDEQRAVGGEVGLLHVGLELLVVGEYLHAPSP